MLIFRNVFGHTHTHIHRHRHSVAHIKWMCIFCSLHCQPSVSLPHIFCSSMYSLYHISALNEFHLIAFSLHVFHRAEYIMNRTPKKSLTSLPTQRHRGKKIVTHIRDLVSYIFTVCECNEIRWRLRSINFHYDIRCLFFIRFSCYSDR